MSRASRGSPVAVRPVPGPGPQTTQPGLNRGAAPDAESQTAAPSKTEVSPVRPVAEKPKDTKQPEESRDADRPLGETSEEANSEASTQVATRAVEPLLQSKNLTSSLSDSEITKIRQNRQFATKEPDSRIGEFLINNSNRFELYPRLGIMPFVWDKDRTLLMGLDPVHKSEANWPVYLPVTGRDGKSIFQKRYGDRISAAIKRFYPFSERDQVLSRLRYLYIPSRSTYAYLANKNTAFLKSLPGGPAAYAGMRVSAVLFVFKSGTGSTAAYFPLGLVRNENGKRRWVESKADFGGYLSNVDVDLKRLERTTSRGVVARLVRLRNAMMKRYR